MQRTAIQKNTNSWPEGTPLQAPVSTGYSPFVAHANARSVDTGYTLEPWKLAIAAADPAYAGNIRINEGLGGRAVYLDLRLAWDGTSDNPTGAPKVRVFGRTTELSGSVNRSLKRHWPPDLLPSDFPVPTDHLGPAHWESLDDPASGDIEIELPVTPVAVYEETGAGSRVIRWGARKQVYLAGTTHHIVTVTEAATGGTGRVLVTARYVT